jgi:hypothetical protein
MSARKPPPSWKPPPLSAKERPPPVEEAIELACQHLFGWSLSRADKAYKRTVVDMLRGNIPLGNDRSFRDWIADELELAWFKTKRERGVKKGKRRREAAANLRQRQIEYVAQRDGISETKAIEKIAEHEGVTVEALKQALKPSRISGDRRRRK